MKDANDDIKSLINNNKQHECLYAEIIIPLALPKTYTWKIENDLAGIVKPGIRVEVALKNKKYAGIVSAIVDKPANFEPKAIINIIDEEPLLYDKQISFWKWIASYYMCTEGEVMQAAIPSNLKLSSESVLIWNDEHSEDFSDLNDNEYLLAEALLLRKELKMSEAQQILQHLSSVYPVIKKLVEKQVCLVWEHLQEKYKQKKEDFILLHPSFNDESKLEELLNTWTKAPKQLELLLAYLHLQKTNGEVSKTELLKKSNATAAQLKGLVDKQILVSERRSKDRLPSLPKNIKIDFELSYAQQQAADDILTEFSNRQTCLLHGVTSSGKTQIYIKLIEQFIKQGKQVLYMLPEIALTAQIIRRLQKHFGGHIAIYHSKFNANERVEIWNKVKSGDIKVVLGARSALFLPFKELGLIILDEEHEPSFKQQEPAPRYHARDAAIYYAGLFNAKVLLGSATPSVETYFNCLNNKYGLVTLSERFGNAQMPAIEIVDLKKYVSRQKMILSPPLHEAIEKTLAEKKQVILFQNRRGYSPYQICNVCGFIPQCHQCAVTLTYHKNKNKLTCHYCGTNYPVLNTCTACGSQQFIQKNFGTEKIEETIAETFPNARIVRMDYDTVKGKYDHDAIIKLFEQQKIDVLIGTQMVVKGLDFEHVQLVGIIDADSILHFADFRVNERAYQLMEQVSGRAGRKDHKGEVLIQIMQSTHPVLAFIKAHDYKAFYENEIQNRQQFFYPPASRIIQLTFKHKEKHIAEEAAHIVATGLKTDFEKYITGPAEPFINKVRNQYIQEILIRLPRHTPLIDACKKQIQQQINLIKNNKLYRMVHIYPDVDPV